MISKQDMDGISAMIPTPCKEGQDGWNNTDSVDLDETARMVAALIRDGITSLAANGTTGECAALSWEEKVAFTDAILQTNQGRIPTFAGCTSLGTKETVRQMRFFRDMGCEGAFVGLPLWQTPTITNSVKFFADLGEAVPDMGIMVYANPMFFKSTFPTEFWVGIGKTAPTVMTAKYVGNLMDPPKVFAELGDSIDAAPGVAFLPIDFLMPAAVQAVGGRVRGAWSTSAAMGPEPLVAFMNAILAGDHARMMEIHQDLTSLPDPVGDFKQFPSYNVQVEKARCNAAGYIKAGPSRAPYQDLPDSWLAPSKANGEAWAKMRKKYMK